MSTPSPPLWRLAPDAATKQNEVTFTGRIYAIWFQNKFILAYLSVLGLACIALDIVGGNGYSGALGLTCVVLDLIDTCPWPPMCWLDCFPRVSPTRLFASSPTYSQLPNSGAPNIMLFCNSMSNARVLQSTAYSPSLWPSSSFLR